MTEQKTILCQLSSTDVVEAGQWIIPTGMVEPGQWIIPVEDTSAYLPASHFFDNRFTTFKAIRKALDNNPWIRRHKPSPQRLTIHPGDWRQFLKGLGKAIVDPLDLPDAVLDAAIEAMEQRRAEERRRKAGA